jgi:hypothetical protein
MVTGPAGTGRWSTLRACGLALLAVLPLLAIEVGSGFRLGLTDPVRSVIAPIEQPLSVRSPSGLWAMGLAAAWFGLAYWRGRFSVWEAGLVVLGGAAALARVGNAWLDALALFVPLARQLAGAPFGTRTQVGLAVLSLGVAGAIVVISRPPNLPREARDAAAAAAVSGAVFADWRWAAELQRQIGDRRQVLAAPGLAGESTDFWLDYLRVTQGHERWTELLQQWNVDLVVLEATDQERQAAGLVRSSSDWHVIFDAQGALVAQRVHNP